MLLPGLSTGLLHYRVALRPACSSLANVGCQLAGKELALPVFDIIAAMFPFSRSASSDAAGLL